jgi:transcription-repair coupling factor (superfamily II helicase)
LNQFNFNFTDFVSEPGEFSVRGGIVDVFSYAYEKPFRITFFGNEVENIKEFDIETQLSTGKVNEFELVSNMNFAVSGSKVSLDLLPKDSFIVTKNAYLRKKLKDFYEKAEQKFETLSKEIKHQKPEILFVSDEIFLEDFKNLKRLISLLNLYNSTTLPFSNLIKLHNPLFTKTLSFSLKI